MKKLMIAILMAVTMQMKAFTPWTKGGFETGKYRNVFVEMGYEPAAVDAKLKEEADRLEDWWQRYHVADEETRRLMACGAIP